MKTWLKWLEKCGKEFTVTEDSGCTIYKTTHNNKNIEIWRWEGKDGHKRANGAMIFVNRFQMSVGSVKQLITKLEEIFAEVE